MARRVRVATSVDAVTAQTLRDRAAMHHLSLSQAVSELLSGAVKEGAPNGDTLLFLAEVRSTFHRDVQRMADRLAYLLVRSALEAGATRREVFNLLVRSGVDVDSAQRIHDGAWQAAMASLRKPVAELRELAAQEEPSPLEEDRR